MKDTLFLIIGDTEIIIQEWIVVIPTLLFIAALITARGCFKK